MDLTALHKSELFRALDKAALDDVAQARCPRARGRAPGSSSRATPIIFFACSMGDSR
jgi:hypothetical protein